MTRMLLVLPADLDQQCYTLACGPDADLLGVLAGAVGCVFVDAVAVDLPGAGRLTMWVDDDGLVTAPGAINARAGKLLDATGRTRAQGIVRDVVITGGAGEDGETLGLSVARCLIVLALLGRAGLL